ncbi:MAG: iron-sulfur cluster assembly scaffold protein [Verrucomicrobiota bacterium]
MSQELNDRLKAALQDPRNRGEMEDADTVGTVGSPDCGDMLRMWLKFSEKDGKKVIDRASFQSFGCQTAIAVASIATEMLQGKTLDEARRLGNAQLAEATGPLPPMKMHCGTLVENALQNALNASSPEPSASVQDGSEKNLIHSLGQATTSQGPKIKIVLENSGGSHRPPQN